MRSLKFIFIHRIWLENHFGMKLWVISQLHKVNRILPKPKKSPSLTQHYTKWSAFPWKSFRKLVWEFTSCFIMAFHFFKWKVGCIAVFLSRPWPLLGGGVPNYEFRPIKTYLLDIEWYFADNNVFILNKNNLRCENRRNWELQSNCMLCSISMSMFHFFEILETVTHWAAWSRHPLGDK